MSLIFIDCEAWGPCPSLGQLTEFGAVDLDTNKTFHGVIIDSSPDPAHPVQSLRTEKATIEAETAVFTMFNRWLLELMADRYIFVSDNPAYDYQWINDGFWRTLGHNPFGHSARRIGDFYAGLVNNFRSTQHWKKLRVTPHDHNPVHDAMGNVEAFRRLIAGER